MFEVSSKIKEIIHASPFLQRTSSHSVVLVRLIIIWTSLLLISSNMKKVSSPAALVLLLALSLSKSWSSNLLKSRTRRAKFRLCPASFVDVDVVYDYHFKIVMMAAEKKEDLWKELFWKREKNQQQQWHWKLKKEAIWKEAVCTTKKNLFERSPPNRTFVCIKINLWSQIFLFLATPLKI